MKKLLWLVACNAITACSLSAADQESESKALTAKITATLEQQKAKAEPVRQKYAEIKRAFVLSEIKLYGKEMMQKNIEQKQTEFDAGWPRANSRGVINEPMRYFYITIKRTFAENSTDPLAQLVFDAIKLHEKDEKIPGFYMRYAWFPNADGTRSLTCRVDAEKNEFEAACDVGQQ